MITRGFIGHRVEQLFEPQDGQDQIQACASPFESQSMSPPFHWRLGVAVGIVGAERIRVSERIHKLFRTRLSPGRIGSITIPGGNG